MWRWIKHGYLAEHCPLGKHFRINITSVEGQGKCPSLGNVLRVSLLAEFLKLKWSFIDKSLARDWFLKSNTHACPLEKRKQQQQQKTKTKTQVILNLSKCIPPKYWKQLKLREDRICVLSEIPLNLADKNQVRKKD